VEVAGIEVVGEEEVAEPAIVGAAVCQEIDVEAPP
jgi:hypothetical protein